MKLMENYYFRYYGFPLIAAMLTWFFLKMNFEWVDLTHFPFCILGAMISSTFREWRDKNGK